MIHPNLSTDPVILDRNIFFTQQGEIMQEHLMSVTDDGGNQ